jgi:hypothetical protein
MHLQMASTKLPIFAALAWVSGVHALCNTCAVRNGPSGAVRSKDYSTGFEPQQQLSTCTYYQNAACCTAATVQAYAPLGTSSVFGLCTSSRYTYALATLFNARLGTGMTSRSLAA